MIQLGLGQRITMLPAMKQRDAFRLARTLVVPSRAEAMPYIVMEAVAAGKPVIASRVGGIPEALGADNLRSRRPVIGKRWRRRWPLRDRSHMARNTPRYRSV